MEIKILGSGPSSLTAAINLARAGHKVTVFEKNPDCGMRFHGDYQGMENWTQEKDVLEDLKSMNIEPDFDYTPFSEMFLAGPERKKYLVKSKRPNYYLVHRGNSEHGNTLDQALKRQALAAGVEIKFNTLVKEEDVDIIAPGSMGGDAIGHGITFDTDAPNTAVTIIDNDIAPGGYAYLFVVNGKGAIVTWYFRHFHLSGELLQKTVAAFDDVAPMNKENIKEFGGAVNFFLEKKYTHGGKPRIGEGAGLQDFFASFGMRYAITSGYLAAKSIIEGKDYDQLIKQRFKDQLEASLVNRFLWERMSNKRFELLLKRLERMEDTQEFLKKFYNMGLGKKVMLPFVEMLMKSKEHRYNCECHWCRSKLQEVN
jgi:flavin-dependent dehydrogenase